MVGRSENWRGGSVAAGVVCLLIILGLQLALSVRRESQTWDEGNHIFAGYMSWIHADFGLNPEHPPMLKLLATAPLLSLPLKAPKLQDRYFKEEAFLGGKDFLYQNDADMILFRTRMAAATLTLLLALLVFLATKEMFGTGAAFIALALLAFEPNLLAHGALVTTDAGFSCFMFATTYAFYRYVKKPSVWLVVIVGLLGGLALAVKHTGFLVFPMLLLLAICEVVRHSIAAKRSSVRVRQANSQIGTAPIIQLRNRLLLIQPWSGFENLNFWFDSSSRPPDSRFFESAAAKSCPYLGLKTLDLTQPRYFHP